MFAFTAVLYVRFMQIQTNLAQLLLALNIFCDALSV
jgi:hypothetical protein